MKKNIFSSIIAQLILLVFVIVWIIPTFGLFISSFRDKDLLAVKIKEVEELARDNKLLAKQVDDVLNVRGARSVS